MKIITSPGFTVISRMESDISLPFNSFPYLYEPPKEEINIWQINQYQKNNYLWIIFQINRFQNMKKKIKKQKIQ